MTDWWRDNWVRIPSGILRVDRHITGTLPTRVSLWDTVLQQWIPIPGAADDFVATRTGTGPLKQGVPSIFDLDAAHETFVLATSVTGPVLRHNGINVERVVPHPATSSWWAWVVDTAEGRTSPTQRFALFGGLALAAAASLGFLPLIISGISAAATGAAQAAKKVLS